MDVPLVPGASLRRIAEIVAMPCCLARVRGRAAQTRSGQCIPDSRSHLLPTDRDVVELFTLLRARQISYLLGADVEKAYQAPVL